MTAAQLQALMTWIKFWHIKVHDDSVHDAVAETEARKDLYAAFGFDYCGKTGKPLDREPADD